MSPGKSLLRGPTKACNKNTKRTNPKIPPIGPTSKSDTRVSMKVFLVNDEFIGRLIFSITVVYMHWLSKQTREKPAEI